MAREDPDRHRNLLRLVQRRVTLGCGKELRNDRDDLTQNVTLALVKILDRAAGQLRRWLADPEQPGGCEALRKSLKDIETFGDRKTLRKLARSVRECLSIVEQQGSGQRLRGSAARLREHFARLQKMDGAKVFAKYFVDQRVHWAISDAKRKPYRPTVRIDPDEDVPPPAPAPRADSLPRRLMIRQAIEDCLEKIPETQYLPCLLALHGNTVPETARYLGLGESQTESRVRRGKQALRRCLVRKGIRR